MTKVTGRGLGGSFSRGTSFAKLVCPTLPSPPSPPPPPPPYALPVSASGEAIDAEISGVPTPVGHPEEEEEEEKEEEGQEEEEDKVDEIDYSDGEVELTL